jgi:hypothetical protein
MSEEQYSTEQPYEIMTTDPSGSATENVLQGSSDAVAESSGPGFGKSFSDCMGDLGLPVPTSLFGTATAAIATIKAIQAAVAAYGTDVTIAELIGAGFLSDALAVAGALTASAYVGACIGCVITAGIDWATA